MANASDPIARFARLLARSGQGPLTIKNYRSTFHAFGAWFEGANGEPMEPAKVNPTDLRQFKLARAALHCICRRSVHGFRERNVRPAPQRALVGSTDASAK